LYSINLNAQVLSTNSSAKNVYFWIRKNGVDEQNTRRTLTLNGNLVYTDFSVSYNIKIEQASDYVEFMWAADNDTVELEAAAQTTFAPSSPSVFIHIDQVVL
jgi:hypothetical protein